MWKDYSRLASAAPDWLWPAQILGPLLAGRGSWPSACSRLFAAVLGCVRCRCPAVEARRPFLVRNAS